MSTVNELAACYLIEESDLEKNKILLEIFFLYKPWVLNLCRKCTYGDIECDDVRQHVHIGIVNGLNDMKPEEAATHAIFRHVRREISNYILRPRIAVTTSRGRDMLFSDYLIFSYCSSVSGVRENKTIIDFPERMGVWNPIWDEEKIILQVDLESVIDKLPRLHRKIINLWLDGFKLCEINTMLKYTNSTYGTVINTHFSKCKETLQSDLGAYARVG